MKKSAFLIIISIFITTVSIIAQTGPSIEFDTKTYDYKDIKEDGGPAKCTFRFTNIGDAPLKLTTVRPGCGCTTSDWTKDEIMPGKKGFISAVYDPMNRPGPFNKAISVETNDPRQERIILFIKGNVLPRQKTTEDFYPVKVGNLRFKTNHLAFMDIKSGSSKTDTLKLYNTWGKTMTIKLIDVPPFISYEIKPKELMPKEEGIILMTYDTKKKKDFGLLFDKFTMETNDEINQTKPINVSAKIVENFANLSEEELAKAPKIKVASKEYNFGSVKQGEIIEHKFMLTNLGETDLEIRKVTPNAGCTIKNQPKSIIKKGEMSSIDVTINTRGGAGKIHKTVTVITNDPLQPTTILNIYGALIHE